MRQADFLKVRNSSYNLFDDYVNNVDLDSDIKIFYDFMDDDKLKKDFENKSKLNKLRNKNYKRYTDINITKFENISYDFNDIIKDTLNLYRQVDYKNLLSQSDSEAKDTKQLLDCIYKNFSIVENIAKKALKKLNDENDRKQSMFSIPYFKGLNISDKIKEELIDKYNDLVLFNSVLSDNIYDDLERQVERRKYIDEILRILNLEEENKISETKFEKLKVLNKKINGKIHKFQSNIQYLTDLVLNDSKYIDEFNKFRDFFNKLIAYDDTSYNEAKQVYETLCDDDKIKNVISNFEDKFIQEIEDTKKEEQKKYIEKEIQIFNDCLNSINTYYMNILDESDKLIINNILEKIKDNDVNLYNIELQLDEILKKIWSFVITDIYDFNPDKDYKFICSNNQFIDEKYQTILITKNEIKKVKEYGDYQIGFICGYSDNIMYITGENDIMDVDFNNVSRLKTPIQLESEFIDFNNCNKIALDGYKTKVEAVYYIPNDDINTRFKAIELANAYDLPLIELDK